MSTKQNTKSSAKNNGMVALDFLRAHCLLRLAALGRQELALDEGQHTTLANSHAAEQLVELLVVANSQLQVTGNDTRLLVVTGSVACKLENLGSKVLKDSSKVDCRVLAKSSHRRQDTYPEHRHRHAEHSCPYGEDGEYDRQGTEVQPWPNATGSWPRKHLPPCHQTCHQKTLLLKLRDTGKGRAETRPFYYGTKAGRRGACRLGAPRDFGQGGNPIRRCAQNAFTNHARSQFVSTYCIHISCVRFV